MYVVGKGFKRMFWIDPQLNIVGYTN
jgi:hypothetical protein